MAKVIKHNTFVPATGGRERKYPWEDWTTGEWWELEQGTDYDCKTVTMQQNAYKWGRRNGFHVETQVPPWAECLRVRFLPKTEVVYEVDPKTGIPTGGYQDASVRAGGSVYQLIGPPGEPVKTVEVELKGAARERILAKYPRPDDLD